MKSEEVKAFIESLDDLIELKTLFRKTTPTYNLDKEMENTFLSLLKSLQQKLQPIFLTYLNDDVTETPDQNAKNNILELMNAGNYALISSNSSKKKLKAIGIDPRNLIVSGGPLLFEDYKIINPNLPEKAFPSIIKKVESLFRDIKKEDWTQKDLIYIYEAANPTDELILEKLEEVSKLIGKKVKTIKLSSWKEIDS